MTKVKVLIEGYAKETKDGWLASSTTVFIQDSGKNVIVDPGVNKKLLLRNQKEGSSPTTFHCLVNDLPIKTKTVAPVA